MSISIRLQGSQFVARLNGTESFAVGSTIDEAKANLYWDVRKQGPTPIRGRYRKATLIEQIVIRRKNRHSSR